MTSALATMRVDYDQVKIKDLDTSNNPLLNKRRKKAAAGAKSGSTVCQSQWSLADWWGIDRDPEFRDLFFRYQKGRLQSRSWTFHRTVVELNRSAPLGPLAGFFFILLLNYSDICMYVIFRTGLFWIVSVCRHEVFVVVRFPVFECLIECCRSTLVTCHTRCNFSQVLWNFHERLSYRKPLGKVWS